MLTFEAAVFLAIARAWLLIVPFRKIAETLGRSYSAAAPKNIIEPASQEQDEIATRVSEAVKRAAKNIPLHAVCIQQAIAAKMMLQRRGIRSVMHFGVARGLPDSGDALRAHAWLQTANVEITGFPLDDDLKEIAYFV
ncbi:MAG TPA: lasso peptide biosynthesis B2 protein [Sphingomicrobium sp.]|nr:lasso peptide biosynthesis B2 protein [Sphingomicrobium sp.]